MGELKTCYLDIERWYQAISLAHGTNGFAFSINPSGLTSTLLYIFCRGEWKGVGVKMIVNLYESRKNMWPIESCTGWMPSPSTILENWRPSHILIESGGRMLSMDPSTIHSNVRYLMSSSFCFDSLHVLGSLSRRVTTCWIQVMNHLWLQLKIEVSLSLSVDLHEWIVGIGLLSCVLNYLLGSWYFPNGLQSYSLHHPVAMSIGGPLSLWSLGV